MQVISATARRVGQRAAALASVTAIASMLALGACVPMAVAAVPDAPPAAATRASRAPSRARYAHLERELLDELNRMRRDPAAYARSLGATLDDYRGNVLYRAGSPTGVTTREGPNAVREAMRDLARQAPLATLQSSNGLAQAALDQVMDQGATGRLGHQGSDGSRMVDRASRYGQWSGRMSESIAYGQYTTGRDVLQALLVDDGVSDRGHRRNALDPSARLAGVACGPHPRYGTICVIDQVTGFTERVAAR